MPRHMVTDTVPVVEWYSPPVDMDRVTALCSLVGAYTAVAGTHSAGDTDLHDKVIEAVGNEVIKFLKPFQLVQESD